MLGISVCVIFSITVTNTNKSGLSNEGFVLVCSSRAQSTMVQTSESRRWLVTQCLHSGSREMKVGSPFPLPLFLLNLTSQTGAPHVQGGCLLTSG